MLYCRMFVEWFSQKMVGPLFIFSFDSSTVRAGGKHKYQRSDSGTKHLQGGDHMPRVRKTTRQFEKDKAAFFAQCKARHAVCWLCGMPIDYAAEKNTSDESYNLDHLYPVSKHQELQFDPAGFRPSHTSCNRLRGNQDPPTPIGTLSRQWITTA
nr:MAG TPA: HNH endonuclease [Caudoviricetes sp.]